MNRAAMDSSPYQPIFELTRGSIRESLHFGAVAIVEAGGELRSSYGDPQAVTYLRSSSKPLQVIAFLEAGGQSAFDLTEREIALMCASHSGTDEHVRVAQSIQSKAGISESELLCGVHPPSDERTAESLHIRGELPTANRHNCSGKHTGMLAYARLMGFKAGNEASGLPYIDPGHPVQRSILETFSQMCGLTPQQVELGIDGCSAPVFAVPLYNSALAYARLCDPSSLKPERASVCHTISTSMLHNPDMVGGAHSFDTHLMRAAHGKVLSKGGAEGYQSLGIMPGAMGRGSPGLGIAIKISDGDLGARSSLSGESNGQVRPAISLEILRQLGALTSGELAELSGFGPIFPIHNWRKIEVGDGRPIIHLG